VRVETSPEDIHGMHAAEGILTTGGMTSHAAVVRHGQALPWRRRDPRRLCRQRLQRQRHPFARARSPSTA
jgi:hypothetical protein